MLLGSLARYVARYQSDATFKKLTDSLLVLRKHGYKFKDFADAVELSRYIQLDDEDQKRQKKSLGVCCICKKDLTVDTGFVIENGEEWHPHCKYLEKDEAHPLNKESMVDDQC